MLAFAFAICSAQSGLIQPPMHRAWTYFSSENTQVLAVRNGTAYFTAQRQIGALDLQTGKPKWVAKADWPNPTCIGANEIFALMYKGEDKPRELVAYDLKTGAQRIVGRCPELEDMAVDSKRVYATIGEAVSAFDQKTGRQLWTKPLREKPRGKDDYDFTALKASENRVFAGLDKNGLKCFDGATGKLIWRHEVNGSFYKTMEVLPQGLLIGFDQLTLLDPATGKPKWTQSFTYPEVKSITADQVVVKNEGQFFGIDLNTSKQLWMVDNRKGDDYYSGGAEGLLPGGAGGFLIPDNERFLSLSAKGKVLSGGPISFSGWPFHAEAKLMATSDGERIFGYIPGSRPSLPTGEAERKALAKKLVADFEALDESEIKDVVALAPHSTGPLIDRYVAWAQEKATEYSKDGEENDPEGRGMLLYGILQETARALSQMCTAADTPALLAALEKLGKDSSYRGELEEIAGARADPNKAIPLFIEQLNESRENPRERGGPALDAVAKSSHPDAVKFMIDALKDPKAPSGWRHMAFVHLAGTGGEAGIAAVRAARAGRGPRPAWEEVLVRDFVPIPATEYRDSNVGSEMNDSEGRTWRLIKSDVLGNGGDFFMQQKLVDGWSKPTFLGFSDAKPFIRAKEETELQVRGIGIKKLLQSEWIKIFPNDAEIRKDSDGDGWTDLVEKRFGTKNDSKDSDGDGLADPVDPCPMTAPREIGDREKIVAAAVEAKFFASGWSVPATISVDGIKPFEMYGYDSILIWSTDRNDGELGRMYGTGMNSIGFSAPREFNDKTEGKDWIQFSDDGKKARTLISRYSGGLNGEGVAVDLIKVGEEWFVVGLRTIYVS